MARKDVEHRSSDTAEVAAGYRAVACKEYPGTRIGSDYLAVHFLSRFHKFVVGFGFIRALGIKKSRKFTPGGYEYVMARTAFFDQQLLAAVEQGARQIVILGAGFDTRAFRFSDQCAQCRIIELDIATTQDRKKECLRQAGIAIPENLTLASINFNRESLSEVLSQAGYATDIQTLFLWEGVSMYLEKSAVDATLRFISANKNPDSLLVFDYIAAIAENDIDKCFGVKTWRETWEKYRQAEPFRFTIDDSQLTSCLDTVGLKKVAHLTAQEIESQYLPKGNSNNLGKVTGWFRFVTTSPDN